MVPAGQTRRFGPDGCQQRAAPGHGRHHQAGRGARCRRPGRPSVVEAMLGRTAHTITAGGVDFVSPLPRRPRRPLPGHYGRLAPGCGDPRRKCAPSCVVIACHAWTTNRYRGDNTTLMGRADELSSPRGCGSARAERLPCTARRHCALFDGVRAFRDDLNPMFYRALAVAAALLVGSTVILRFGSNRVWNWVDAFVLRHRDHDHRRLWRFRPARASRCGFGCGAW